MDESQQVVRRLLKAAGTTYAAEAGIRINDKPMPLFQLLVLCMLASKPIDATTAMRAARELFKDGLRTQKAVLASDRQPMIKAFGHAREIARRSNRDVGAAARILKQFKGIGDTGADIFLREVQDVWTWARPYFDNRATTAAKQLGLPIEPAKLEALAPRARARLAAALVRASLDDDLREQVTG